MKYSFLGGLALSAVVLLSGCLGPSVPQVKDVEAGLLDGWSSCKMLRPVNIKKTNGIDRGDFYQMEVEYRLEFVSDIAKEDIWGQDLPEVDPRNYNLLNQESSADFYAAHEPHRQATRRKEKFWEENCPEPTYSYFWQLSALPEFKTVSGKDVKSGDGFNVQTVFDMIKTERGWETGR